MFELNALRAKLQPHLGWHGLCSSETWREASVLKTSTTMGTLGGQWLNEVKPLDIKAHGCLAKSVFRDGFDYLWHILLNLAQP